MRTWLFGKENNISRKLLKAMMIPDKAVAMCDRRKGEKLNYKSECAKDYGNVYTVYVHVCPDGKRYIGMTRQDLHKRWHGGSGYRNQKEFYKAISDFGWENIEHKIVLENVDLKTAGEKEQELIKKYDTQNPEHGFNTKNGGQTFGEHSEEFLDSLKDRMAGNTYCLGRKISEKHIKALKEGRKSCKYKREKGVYHHSAEAKKKLSESAKRRYENPEYVEKMKACHPDVSGKNNPMFGKHHSKETRDKIAQTKIGRRMSDEARIKMSENSTVKRKVVQISIDGTEIAEFHSIKDAALSVGACTTNISLCCRNRNRTCKGYRWRYADDNS